MPEAATAANEKVINNKKQQEEVESDLLVQRQSVSACAVPLLADKIHCDYRVAVSLSLSLPLCTRDSQPDRQTDKASDRERRRPS